MDSTETKNRIKTKKKQYRGLVVLDMNGIFTYRIYNQDHKKNKLPMFEIFYRPGSHEFIKKLVKNKYKVAFFTSTTKKNALPIIKEVVKNYFSRLLFVWTRDRCTFDPEPLKGHDTVKNLASIWNNPVINQMKKYGSHNTVLVDDSVRKVRYNDSKNYIIVKEYNPSEDIDEHFFDNLFDEIQTKI